MLGAGQFLHRVDQQLAAFGIELELGLVDPDELDATYVAARVGLDGVDNHAGVQRQPDFACLHQLVAEGGQAVGRLDRHHPHLAGAALDRGLRGIGGHGATADDDHVTATREVVRDDVVGAHPQEFHRRDHFRQVGAGHRQDAPGHHADREEDGVIVVEELLELDVLADVLIDPDVDAHVDDHLNFPEQLVVVETEMRDAGGKQAAELGFPLVKVDRITHETEILDRSHARRPGAHHGDPPAILRRPLPIDAHPTGPRVIGGEALQRFDRDRVLGSLDPAALAVGLAGMVAEPSEHRGKGVGFMDDEPGVKVAALRDVVDIGRDVLMDRAGALTGRDGNVEAQVATADEDLVGRCVGRRLADLLQDFVSADHTDGLRSFPEERSLILGHEDDRRVLPIHDVRARLQRVGDVAPRQRPAHVLLNRPAAIGERGEGFPVPEEPDKGAPLDDQERIGARGGQSLERVGRGHVRGTGRTDGLEDSAERRHQVAAIAIATSRAVRAPSGMPAEVVTRITCRPLSRSTRTAAASASSGRTSGSGVRTMSAARPPSSART